MEPSRRRITDHDDVLGAQKSEFKRPSDYRKISMGMEKMKDDDTSSIDDESSCEKIGKKMPIREELTSEIRALVSALCW